MRPLRHTRTHSPIDARGSCMPARSLRLRGRGWRVAEGGSAGPIKALSLYLGHADPGFTLRVYTHLLPSSEDRTRRAIDRAFGHAADTPDGLETA
jgi:integrase